MKFIFLFISLFFLTSIAFTQREGRSAGTYSGSSGFTSPGNSAAVAFAVATNSERTSFVGYTLKEGAAGDRMYGNLSAIYYPERTGANHSSAQNHQEQRISTFSSRSHTHATPLNINEGRTVHAAVTLNPGVPASIPSLPKQEESQVNRKLNEVVHNQDMREILLAELALRLTGNCDDFVLRLQNTQDLTAAEIRLLLFVYWDCVRLKDIVYNRLSRLPLGGSAIKIYSGSPF